MLRGEARAGTGDWEEAAEDYRHALELLPEDSAEAQEAKQLLGVAMTRARR